MPPSKFTFPEFKESIGTLEKRLQNGKDYSQIKDECQELMEAYFQAGPVLGGTFFAPDLKLRANLGADTELTLEATGQVLDWANRLTRISRHAHFFGQRQKANETKPVVVSKGDSWFQFPVLLKDTIDVLMTKQDYLIYSLDKAGDTVQNMAGDDDYSKALDNYGAKILLLSAGGNDALGNGQLTAYLVNASTSLKPSDYLLPRFDTLIQDAMREYSKILEGAKNCGAHTICHGYSYNNLEKHDKWLSEPMTKNGITAPEIQKQIVREMVDRFNFKLKELISTNFKDSATYLDVRNCVEKGQWFDEIHPSEDGFKTIAKAFHDAITGRIKASPSSTV